MKDAPRHAASGKGTSWRRTFSLIFLANMTMYLGMQIADTMVAVYASHLGASSMVVGMVTSLFAATALAFKIVSGPAIDAFYKKHIILFALAILAAAFLGMSLTGSIPMLVVFRLLQGTGRAFSATCFLALVSEILPRDRFSAGIGTFAAAQACSQAISPSIGLFLADHFGFHVTFFASFCFVAGAFVLTCFIRVENTSSGKFRLRPDSIVAREAVLPALLTMLLTMAFSSVSGFLVLYAAERGVGSSIGIYFTVYAGALLLFRPISGWLTDRYGTLRVVLPSLVFYALSFLLTSTAKSMPVFLLAALCAAFGYGATTPAFQSLCMKSVPESRCGAASSTSYIGCDLGSLLGPVLAGILVDAVGYAGMWRLMMAPIALATGILLANRARFATVETAFTSRK